MLKINKPLKFTLYFVIAALIVSCSEADKIADEIIEEIDTDEKAKLSMINTLDHSVSFHIKSEIYNRSVYNSDFFLAEVAAKDVSPSKEFRWVDGYDDTEIAIKNTNIQETDHSIDFNLPGNKLY